MGAIIIEFNNLDKKEFKRIKGKSLMDRESIKDGNDIKMIAEKTTKAVEEAEKSGVSVPVERTTKQYYLTDGYGNFLVEYDGDLIAAIEGINDMASAFLIDGNYAIVSIRYDMYRSVLLGVSEIVHVSSEGIYTLEAISPSEASNAISFHYNPYLNLTGYGTVIGILDTGIDYLNNDFIKEDGTTKIIRIWDQSIESNKEESVYFGSEYTGEDINKAIKANKEGQDPYSIVPSKDINGHGTAMAGLIASRGNGKNVMGIANNAEIVMVKLKTADEGYKKYFFTEGKTEYQYRSSDILIALKYLFRLSKRIDKPMAIFIPLGSTIGGHDGNSIIEKYIDDISRTRGIVVITSTGNQGNTQVHTSGTMERTGNKKRIEVNIGKDQKNILLNIYSNKPDKFGLSIISPSGEAVNNIAPKSRYGTNVSFLYEGASMVVNFIEPDEISGDGIIIVRAENVTPGIWNFELLGEYIVNGKYDAWLVQKDLLSEGTRFINPVQYTTLTMPASSKKIISVTYYNQINNALVAQSGRGYTRDGRIKPIIAAGGVDAIVTAPGNKESVMSGGSVAGAVITGCCALLLQWGLVDKNDLTLYAMKIQGYLMRGTNKRMGETYPNEQWGYGTINMKELFDNVVGLPPANEKSLSSVPIGFRSVIEMEGQEDGDKENYLKDIYVKRPLEQSLKEENNHNIKSKNVKGRYSMNRDGKGRLKCQCFVGDTIEPLSKSKITLTSVDKNEKEQVIYTDSVGSTEEIELNTPNIEASQKPGTVPYSTYNIKVEREGFLPLMVNGVQVYPNRLAIQNCNITFNNTSRAQRMNIIDIGDNTLVGKYPAKIPEDPIKPLPKPSNTVVLPAVQVPQYVVVHAGVPNNTNAPNYKVLYTDYIKNVASSEIYSTWPEESIRANIYCILSFTMNRIYTEWYRGKGKTFTITNSTAYDQAYEYGRTIYDNISNIVDEIFTAYIKQSNQKQPFLAQYCNGTTVTCPNWLSQWGSKYLADKGDSAIAILNNYYGYNIAVDTAPKVEGIPESYPGTPLKMGVNNIYVRRLQEYLNSIATKFPSIQKVAVNGSYGPETVQAVKTYQKIFNLPQTGIVDYATWYSISNIYVAVNKLAAGVPRGGGREIFIPPVMMDIEKNIPLIRY